MSAPSRNEIERIAERIAHDLTRSEPPVVSGTDADVAAALAAVIAGNFATEAAIEREAQAALEGMGRAAYDMDKTKLLHGLRMRLAKQKGFTY